MIISWFCMTNETLSTWWSSGMFYYFVFSDFCYYGTRWSDDVNKLLSTTHDGWLHAVPRVRKDDVQECSDFFDRDNDEANGDR